MTEQRLEGGCLCRGVRYTVVGTPQRFYFCHCSRCRKVSGSAHAANIFVRGSLTWEHGESQVARFKLPEAERFTNTFCTQCGSRLPRAVAEHGMVLIPAGSLDTEPTMAPQAHIHTDSSAGWSCVHASLDELDGSPSA